MTGRQSWNADDYRANAAFVPELGRPVLELLDPRPGERVLDLGCGDGTLTAELVAAGCTVVGVDSADDMVRAARRRGIDARVMGAASLAFREEFDAVFSNAVLHWVSRADDAVAGVARALRPGGRFVGEFGGHGNVAAVVTALAAVLDRRGVDAARINPWFYPSPDDYRRRLENAGFEVAGIELIPRPTPLPTGIAGWLATFAGVFFESLPVGERDGARDETVRFLRHSLCDTEGNWTADYVRLRFSARLACAASKREDGAAEQAGAGMPHGEHHGPQP